MENSMTNDKNTMPMRKIRGIKPQIIISGIGTGGHYFPALVVAKELKNRKIDVIFLVRKGCFEEKMAKIYNLQTFIIKPKGYYGKSLEKKILSLCSIVYSLYLLQPITKKIMGIAFGGFGALPLILSCIINRCPYYLFESNRIPGRVTKLFLSRARRVFLGMPFLTELPNNCVVTGIPIRKDFKRKIHRFSKTAEGQKKVLFYGGSQGAHRLNKLALELQEILPKKYQLTIISGKRDYHWVNSQKNGRTKVIAFTTTPWDEICNADLIVSRSGALAGYEILSANKPTIFIPYPYAVDDHQYYNAEYFSSIGNAIVVREKMMTKKMIVETIIELMKRKTKKEPNIVHNAEQKIADEILREIK
jgi:UDP-N-acetylglucosamine--N-acetylmuramyl-(pentapeptide) pyrophosphoryl-undecaprenol N-acetylglucosamine transferase